MFFLFLLWATTIADMIARVPCWRGASLGGAVRWHDNLLTVPPTLAASTDANNQRVLRLQRHLNELRNDQFELSRHGIASHAPLDAAIARLQTEINGGKMVSMGKKAPLMASQLAPPSWWEAEAPPAVVPSPLDAFNTLLNVLPTSSDTFNVIAHYIECREGHDHSHDVGEWAAHALRGALLAALGEEGAAFERRIMRYVDRVLAADAHEDEDTAARDVRRLGTLMLIARANHRQRRSYSPRVFDGARLIDTWNSLINDTDAAIPSPDKVDDVIAAWREANADAGNNSARIGVVVGASYASSFMGMIHFTSERNVRRRDMEEHAESVRAVVDFANRVQSSLGRTGFARDENVFKRVHEAARIRFLHTRIGAMARGVALPQLPLASRAPGGAASQNATAAAKKQQQWREKSSKPRRPHDTRSKMRGRSFWDGGTMMSWVRSSMHGDAGGSQPDLDDMPAFLTLFDSYVKAVRDATDGAPDQCEVLVLSRADVLREWATALRDNGVERTEAPCDCQIDDGCAFVKPDD
jgi:hypothetical protein